MKKNKLQFLNLKNYSKTTRLFVESVMDELNNRGSFKANTEGCLLQLAENYEDFLNASKDIKENGLSMMTSWGKKINPMYAVKEKAQQRVDKIMVELMLTPKMAIRQKEITGEDVNGGDMDLMGQFLQLKKEVEHQDD